MIYIHRCFKFLGLLLVPLILSPAVGSTEKDDVDAGRTLDCVINPSMVADLGSGVPGILSTIRVDRGDFVDAGDVIAELDSGVESVSLDLARTKAELTSEVDLRRVNAAFGQRQNKRTKDLFQRKAISADDMDQRQTEARLAQIQLRQARDNQSLAQLEMLRAQEILNRRTVKTPISGVVMDRFKVVGEYVEDKPVARVAQIDPLHVEAIVPVDQLGSIRSGMQAKVWSEAVNGTDWHATVDRVDRIADVASGTYGVRLSMANPDHKIPAGLRCRLQFLPGGTAAAEAEPAPVVTAEDVGSKVISPPAVVEPELADTKPAGLVEAQANKADPIAVKQAPDNLVPEALVAKQTPSSPVPAPAQLASLCGWLGPYESARAARVASKPLRADGVDVSVRKKPTKKMVGLKIVSPPLYSRSERKSYLDRLRAAKVQDFVPLSKKNGAWRISLGLYHSRGPAEERVQHLQDKGFEVEIGPWYKERQKHWLLVQGDLSRLDAGVAQQLDGIDSEAPDAGLCSALASR